MKKNRIYIAALVLALTLLVASCSSSGNNKGENELVTTLVNIDQNNTIIDHLDIAYDEIAESALRTISIISKANIVVEDWNYFNENNQKTTKTYLVTSDGKFEIN